MTHGRLDYSHAQEVPVCFQMVFL